MYVVTPNSQWKKIAGRSVDGVGRLIGDEVRRELEKFAKYSQNTKNKSVTLQKLQRRRRRPAVRSTVHLCPSTCSSFRPCMSAVRWTDE